ncbi:MAG: hypothetical protein JWM44_1541 [Bacilli bacterium]|nr:hypothetical protein [Bacilli bacterium]
MITRLRELLGKWNYSIITEQEVLEMAKLLHDLQVDLKSCYPNLV